MKLVKFADLRHDVIIARGLASKTHRPLKVTVVLLWFYPLFSSQCTPQGDISLPLVFSLIQTSLVFYTLRLPIMTHC